MKIRPVGADMIHAEGQTDIRKIEVAFRKFLPTPKNIEV